MVVLAHVMDQISRNAKSIFIYSQVAKTPHNYFCGCPGNVNFFSVPVKGTLIRNYCCKKSTIQTEGLNWQDI